jgi:hypothetical protein
MCEEAEEGGGRTEAAAYALSAEAVGGGRPREHASGDSAHSRERRRDHLHADGGIAVLVVRLMAVLDVLVVVTLRVLLRRDVASECAESEASTTP